MLFHTARVEDEMRIGGSTALVTGANRGLGKALVRALLEAGCAKVYAGARNVEGVAPDRLVQPLQLDITNGEQVAAAAAQCGDVDILINNAGAIPGGTIDDVDEPAWRIGWDLKVFGYIGLTRLYLQKMKARRRGVIVNIIGAGGERLDFGYIAGAAGNAGLMAFTRAIGGTSPEFGVRVVGVNPGPVQTDRIETLSRKRAAALYGDENRWRETFAKMPFGRPATTDEIAAMVVFLASDLSAYTSGTIVTIDGGLTYRSQP